MDASRVLGLGACLLLGACAGATHYPIDVPVNPEVQGGVVALARSVDHDTPKLPLDGEGLRASALIAEFVAPLPAAVTVSRAKELQTQREQLAAAVLERGQVIAVAFVTSHGGKEAFHEVAVGTIALPFETFVRRFRPAERWGRELAGWIGGAWQVDVKDAGGRPEQARERMVLQTPWYTIGAPDLDMSKYEVTSRRPGEVVVHWQVTRSANGSVHLDIGYVAFRRRKTAGKEATLVIFSSIHRIDPGFMGGLMPDRMRQGITKAALRDLFAGHIARYRAAVQRARP